MQFEFELYYISSSSIISILELIKRISQLQEKDAYVSVLWRYDEDDEDIRKIGEDYSRLAQVDFRIESNG